MCARASVGEGLTGEGIEPAAFRPRVRRSATVLYHASSHVPSLSTHTVSDYNGQKNRIKFLIPCVLGCPSTCLRGKESRYELLTLLFIQRVLRVNEHRGNWFGRVCLDSVIGITIPWHLLINVNRPLWTCIDEAWELKAQRQPANIV